MNNFLESDWVNLIILVVQAGIVKFAYNLYKEYKKEQEEKDKKAQNIDGAITGLYNKTIQLPQRKEEE